MNINLSNNPEVVSAVADYLENKDSERSLTWNEAKDTLQDAMNILILIEAIFGKKK